MHVRRLQFRVRENGGGITDTTGNSSVNPQLVSIVASDANADETASDVGVFTILRSGTTSGALTVDLARNGGSTATFGSGNDYDTPGYDQPESS